jgi:glycosyltransferase involved in cell wall biosynthesis
MAPTGQYLHDLARELVAQGHYVSVWCSRRSYNGGRELYPANEVIDGVEVKRIRALGFGRKSYLGKLADYATFYSLLARRCLLAGRRSFPKYDVVISLTTPPFIGLLGNVVAHRCGGQSIHWVMDLYPDVMVAHGMVRKGGLRFKLLAPFTQWGFRHADQIWALGQFQRRKIERYLKKEKKKKEDGPKLVDIPLWRLLPEHHRDTPPTATELEARRTELGWNRDTFGIMYSGNMGLGHRFDTILAGIKNLFSNADSSAENTKVAFVGGGKRKNQIETFLADNPLEQVGLHDYVPANQLAVNLQAADLHLICMHPAWQGLIVPSKLMNILGSGRPVLYVGPRDNEIARWIEQARCGWIVDTDDVEGFAAAVSEARSNPERCERRGRRGQLFAAKAFAREINAKYLVDCVTNENLPTPPQLPDFKDASSPGFNEEYNPEGTAPPIAAPDAPDTPDEPEIGKKPYLGKKVAVSSA